jgi:transmembrane sensor
LAIADAAWRGWVEPMNSKDEQVRATIAEQASEWFVANDEGPLDAEESAALVAWFKASPQNVEEFLGVAVIARDLSAAGADPEHSVESLIERARADNDARVESLWPRLPAALSGARIRWQTAAATIAALALVSVGLFLMWNRPPLPGPVSPADATALHFETRHGEQQTHRLADNSVLHLNTDTAVTVQYSKTERRVVLTSGQAGFEVAHEPERPFRVFAGPAEAIARGTKFDVRLGSDSTVVTVVEGRVAVGPSELLNRRSMSSNPRQPVRLVELGPDQQVSVSKDEWPATITAVDAKRTTAWLHRQIAFDHEPLERVAAEFNRYAAKPVEITTPELRKLEITGTFSIDDSEEFLAFLRSLDGVQVDVTATRVLVSKK